MIHHNRSDSLGRDPIRFVLLNDPMLCVYVFVCACSAAFIPSFKHHAPLLQPHCCTVSRHMTTRLQLAEKSIHHSTCQSYFHGNGLAALWRWQGSGTALPGGSCVLIWVVEDASGQGERGKGLCGNKVRGKGLPHE